MHDVLSLLVARRLSIPSFIDSPQPQSPSLAFLPQRPSVLQMPTIALKPGLSPFIPARTHTSISIHPPSRPSGGEYFGYRMKPRKKSSMGSNSPLLYIALWPVWLASAAHVTVALGMSCPNLLASQHVKIPHLISSLVLLLTTETATKHLRTQLSLKLTSLMAPMV